MTEKYLFAASTGGHLAELVRLADRFDASDDSVWITFDTDQSRSLLQGKRVVHVPYIRPRDVAGVVAGARVARKIIRDENFDCAVSTGAALALSVLPQARLARVRSLYIESVSRLEGPSLSGRLIALSRSSELYTQHSEWAGKRWSAIPSVLSSYESAEVSKNVPKPKVFVTLGTIQGYRFDRLVDAVVDSGLADERTTWQLGDTPRTGLPGTACRHMNSLDFEEAIRSADIVITHAGVGTILQSLEMGKYPVIVPRSKSHDEHVDDHQFQIADKVRQMRVGQVLNPQEIDKARVLETCQRLVRPVGGASVESSNR